MAVFGAMPSEVASWRRKSAMRSLICASLIW
jgi:hypothetical protein